MLAVPKDSDPEHEIVSDPVTYREVDRVPDMKLPFSCVELATYFSWRSNLPNARCAVRGILIAQATRASGHRSPC